MEHITALNQCVDELKQYQELTFKEFCATSKHYWAVQHGLQLAIQSVLDIGNHLIAAETPRSVEEYRDIIVAMGEEGMLPMDFANRIADMAGFRNILVHRYLVVDLHRVYDLLQNNLDDFRFCQLCAGLSG